MKTKALAIGLIVLIGCMVAGIMLNRRPAPEITTVKPRPAVQATAQPASPPIQEIASPKPALPIETATSPSETKTAPPSATAPAQPQPSANQPKQQLQDPNARIALALVGEDPDAEAYWEDAIFDTSLPDKEREDLMEDLNEEGLSDPRHLTQEDMQLIAARIPIINEVAFEATQRGDLFMLEHLGEAYKDLWNLLDGGAPQ
ncbi:MAG: hypothetical protein ACTHLW_16105 [Verrucomicrobiota bacterium]